MEGIHGRLADIDGNGVSQRGEKERGIAGHGKEIPGAVQAALPHKKLLAGMDRSGERNGVFPEQCGRKKAAGSTGSKDACGDEESFRGVFDPEGKNGGGADD